VLVSAEGRGIEVREDLPFRQRADLHWTKMIVGSRYQHNMPDDLNVCSVLVFIHNQYCMVDLVLLNYDLMNCFFRVSPSTLKKIRTGG